MSPILWLAMGARGEPVLIHQLPPRYPTSPGVEAEGEVRCVVAVTVGEDGVAVASEINGCAPPFAVAVESVLGAWRWAPSPGAGPQTVELLLVFPELPPDPPAYRDLIVGLGPQLSDGGSVGTLRLRMVAAARDSSVAPLLGGDVELQAHRIALGRWSVSGGASLGGERLRSAWSVGLGQIQPDGIAPPELWIPVEGAAQLELGPIRGHLRGRLAWSLAEPRGGGLGPDPGGRALAIGATWKTWSAFDPIPGPRIDLELRGAAGAASLLVVIGAGL
ncbi:MAG TPA: hypothetical protein ENK18_18320 [Deltaproteobacteria bacterium]|nr:hypothetical protein [Deltaproteobacteria bacterium]